MNMDRAPILRTNSFEDEVDDEISLIPRQKLIISGASNVMVQWTSHVTKCLLSGLAATIMIIVIIIMYLAAAKADDTTPPQRYIFFVDASEKVTPQRACAAEYVVRLHKDIPCYLFLMSNPTPALTLLADIYPNFYVRKWNWMSNLRETPMEPWREYPEFLRAHLLNSSTDALEMTARALTLWKYGGTSLSLDRLTIVEYEDVKGDEKVNYNLVDACHGAIVRLQPCHVFMERLILEIMHKVESGERYDARELFINHLRQFCPFTKDLATGTRNCMGIKVLNQSSTCSMKGMDEIIGDYCPRVKSFSDFKVESVRLNKKLVI